MSTEIKVWQIDNGKLEENKTSLVGSGRKEAEDLEKWIVSDPNIISQDILIIGEQVQTRSGVIDFLGIDQLGNLLVIELKTIPKVFFLFLSRPILDIRENIKAKVWFSITLAIKGIG